MRPVFDILLFLAIIIADRGTKLLVPAVMKLHESVEVVPGFFNITYIRNTGGAFGLLAGWDSPFRRPFLILASLAALTLLVYLYRQTAAMPLRGFSLALVAIGAGAVGNLYDRIVMGEVVDFLDMYIGRHHWPAFNVADSAISVSVGVLLYYYITGRMEETVADGQEGQDAP